MLETETTTDADLLIAFPYVLARPERISAHVAIGGLSGKKFIVEMSAEELLSFPRFCARVLAATHYLFEHEAQEGGKAGRIAWLAEIKKTITTPCPNCKGVCGQ